MVRIGRLSVGQVEASLVYTSYRALIKMYAALQSCIRPENQYTTNVITGDQMETPNYYQHYYDQYNYQHSLPTTINCNYNNQNYNSGNSSSSNNNNNMENGASQVLGSAGSGLQIADESGFLSVNRPSSCRLRHKHPSEVKPPYSYAALICLAIGSDKDNKATMREILDYVEVNFPYYRSNRRWHGTIRHDLTVNDCFMKLSPRRGEKACLWAVDPDFHDMFTNGGSLRRRRYRFKKGSQSWLKSRTSFKHPPSQHTSADDVTPASPEASSDLQPTADSMSPCHEDALMASLVGRSTPEYHHRHLHHLATDSSHPPPTGHHLTSTPSGHLIDTQQSTAASRPYQSIPSCDPFLSNELFTSIPDFDDCVNDLYHSFQTDYYMTM